MEDFLLWHSQSDRIVFGSPILDALLICREPRQANNTSPQDYIIDTPELACDEWQLALDGTCLLYKQDNMLNLYHIDQRRIVNSEIFSQGFETCSQTSEGLVLATIAGDFYLWPKGLKPPVKLLNLRGGSVHERADFDWVRCHGNRLSPWACVFGSSGYVTVFNTQTKEMRAEVGFGGQIVVTTVYGQSRAMLARLSREGQGQLELSVTRLYDSDGSPQELFRHVVPLPEYISDAGLIAQILLNTELSCLVVIFAARNSDRAVANIYDYTEWRFLQSETVGMSLNDSRADGRGRLLWRSPRGDVWRLDIDQRRLALRRQNGGQ